MEVWNLPSESQTEGKGKGFSLKKQLFFFSFHTKIDPFAKQFLSQEAPPPIALETEGWVRCWDGHITAHTPSGDALRKGAGGALRLVQRCGHR